MPSPDRHRDRHHRDQHKRRSSASASPTPPPSKRLSTAGAVAPFPSHHTTPNLPPHIRRLCDLIAATPSSSIEATLSSFGHHNLSSSDVETILSLSYGSPSSAVKFFRWSAALLPPTPYSWNLVIDILGKNRLFDPMWHAALSMHSQRLLSLATFASIFSSYASAADFPAALRSFDDMQSIYSVPKDTPALNSLLSAVCRVGRTDIAQDFLRLKRHEVQPDSDSYAILLEGWENEGDARQSRRTFDEMVERLGYDPNNVPAYDSFLCAVMKGGSSGEAMRYLGVLKEKRCYPGMKFFRKAMEEFVRAEDAKGANSLWESLVGRNGCLPDAKIYSLMIELQCLGDKAEAALKYLDEMVLYGAFPDEKTYNVVLQCFLKGRRVREAAAIFEEMVKNEVNMSESNCSLAVWTFVDAKDYEEVGFKVWKCMVENGYPSEEAGNRAVDKLVHFKLPEACKFAEDMIDRRVKLTSANLSRLRTGLLKIGKASVYDHILKKWKSR